MQGSNDRTVQNPDLGRVLNLGAMRVHNNHLQSGIQTIIGCAVCVKGLEGAMAAVEAKPVDESVGVDEGDGGDEEGDSSPSSSFWDSR